MEYNHKECEGCANAGSWCIGCQPMKVGDKFTRSRFSRTPTELHVTTTIECPPINGFSDKKEYLCPQTETIKEVRHVL